MNTVYGNHINTMRRLEPIVKIFQTKPVFIIVHTLFTPLEALGWEWNYS